MTERGSGSCNDVTGAVSCVPRRKLDCIYFHDGFCLSAVATAVGVEVGFFSFGAVAWVGYFGGASQGDVRWRASRWIFQYLC